MSTTALQTLPTLCCVCGRLGLKRVRAAYRRRVSGGLVVWGHLVFVSGLREGVPGACNAEAGHEAQANELDELDSREDGDPTPETGLATQVAEERGDAVGPVGSNLFERCG